MEENMKDNISQPSQEKIESSTKPRKKMSRKKKAIIISSSIAGSLVVVLLITALCIYINPIPVVKILRNMVYNGSPNKWEPQTETVSEITESGVLMQTNFKYGEDYPNSYFDIYYSSEDKTVSRPTFLYIHGGGYVGGSKNTGDPFAEGGESNNVSFYTDLALQGYNVVSMDYAFAPEYTYPVQMVQINQVLQYLTDNSDTLGIDMNRIIIGGSSAGAFFTLTYSTILTNADYAKEFGITPIISREQLKAIVIDDSPIMHKETRTFVLDAIHKALFGTTNLNGKWGTLAKIYNFVTEDFPPAFLCPGNAKKGEDTFGFEPDMRQLSEAMTAKNVENEFFFLDKSYGDLPHSYFFNNHGDKGCADMAFDAMLKFLESKVFN